MKHLLPIFMIAALAIYQAAWAKGYMWVDEQGITHLTNDPDEIPESKKDKVKEYGDVETDHASGGSSKESGDSDGEVKSKTKAKRTAKGGTEIPYRTRNKTMLIDVSVNGKSMEFLLDTGATSSVITPSLQEEMRFEKVANSSTTLQTGNGPVETYMVWIDELKIGTEKLMDVKAAVLDFGKGTGTKGIVGMNVLELYSFSMNPKKKTVTLDPL